MPWAAAAAVGGALISSQATKNAAGKQVSAEREAIASQERMFDKQLELMEPYREAGYGAIEGLQQLVSPEGRAQSLQDFYASPEYQAMQNQAAETSARYSAATGGLRSGSSYADLQNIAPQLGQSFLANQYNQYSGLANLGMGAASQGVQGAQYLGSQKAQGMQNIGQANAQNSLAQANIYSGLANDLAGMYQSGMFGGGS